MNKDISMKYQGMKDHFIDYISIYSDTFFAKKSPLNNFFQLLSDLD